jgi:hypothetical protein
VSLGEKKFSACFGKGCASGSAWGGFWGNYYDFGEEEDEVKAFSGMRR